MDRESLSCGMKGVPATGTDSYQDDPSGAGPRGDFRNGTPNVIERMGGIGHVGRDRRRNFAVADPAEIEPEHGVTQPDPPPCQRDVLAMGPDVILAPGVQRDDRGGGGARGVVEGLNSDAETQTSLSR